MEQTTHSRFINGELITGWFSPEDGSYYHQMVSKFSGGTVIEIGVYNGLSMSYIVELARKNCTKIIGIDCLLRPTAKWLQSQFPETITLLEMQSEVASHRFADKSINLIFVDGDHSYEQVCVDIVSWMPKLRCGHWMLGHDYNWEGVRKAVKNKLPKHHHIPTWGNLWTAKKPCIYYL